MASDDLRRDVGERVRAFLRDEVVNDATLQIDEHADIIDIGLIDSMGIVRLLAFVQATYEIKEFDYDDIVLDNFRTVGKIASTIVRYLHTEPVEQRAKTAWSPLTATRKGL